MGAFADSLFSVLMSWVRALVSGIWALLDAERTTLLEFLGKNWIVLAVLIIAAGLVVDWLIWLIRWQPYHIWAMRVRRLLRIAPPGEEEAYGDDASAYMPPQREPEYKEEPQEEAWLPLETPDIGEEEVRQVLAAAEHTPDERQYPGMRYDDARTAAHNGQEMGGTRRYAAVHAEGPGAAEVTRRRAEIDAWQLQMQDEARQKAQAERAARMAEAERGRKAAQEAYVAEQARLAQEEYERQLAEYERQRAQYERDLAEYERQKAEYEAALAQQAAEEQASARHETAQELAPAGSARRRRRSAVYSDYVEGEDVTELPAAPEWQPMQQMEPAPRAKEPEAKAEKKSLWRSGMAKMAQMMEPEESDITGIASLPPRVDMHKAYKPAKKPGEK